MGEKKVPSDFWRAWYNVPAVVKNPGTFLSTQDTINSARERGSQKSLLLCTHALKYVTSVYCVDRPILYRLICDSGGGGTLKTSFSK